MASESRSVSFAPGTTPGAPRRNGWSVLVRTYDATTTAEVLRVSPRAQYTLLDAASEYVTATMVATGTCALHIATHDVPLSNVHGLIVARGHAGGDEHHGIIVTSAHSRTDVSSLPLVLRLTAQSGVVVVAHPDSGTAVLPIMGVDVPSTPHTPSSRFALNAGEAATMRPHHAIRCFVRNRAADRSAVYECEEFVIIPPAAAPCCDTCGKRCALYGVHAEQQEAPLMQHWRCLSMHGRASAPSRLLLAPWLDRNQARAVAVRTGPAEKRKRQGGGGYG